MADFRANLANMLRNIRMACGYTQDNVAKILKVDRSTYTYYETCKTSPDIETLRTLAVLFSIPVEAFLYPEKYTDLHIERTRVRSKKTPCLDPRHLGELTKEEKEVIAAYRVKT